jgi:thymidylate kinase
MIALSGIDCAGKSTQLEKLNDYFEQRQQRTMIVWSRGGYTPLLEKFKNFIKGKKIENTKEKEIRDKVHSSCFLRKVLLWGAILDLCLYYGVYFRFLEWKGTTIIADRYVWDTYIDFLIKYEDINFEKWIVWKLLLLLHLKPKKSIVLSISAEESMRRSTLKFEPFPENLEERAHRINFYLKFIKEGYWETHIDASAPVEDVFEKIVGNIS